MLNFDAVLFDFDGTVADTGEGVFCCVRHSIEVFGLEQPSDEDIRKFIGPPLLTSYHSFFPQLSDKELDEIVQCFRTEYDKFGKLKYRIYDGIEDLLKLLYKKGIKTAVASSKPQDFLEQILADSGIDKYFSSIVGASKGYNDSDKASIVNTAIKNLGINNHKRVLMVGDRKFDIIGAKKVGVPCAAVLYGYGNREEFEEYKAEYIVENCNELAKIILN